MDSWLETELGKYVFVQEKKQFEMFGKTLYGRNFLLIGNKNYLGCATECTIANKYIISGDYNKKQNSFICRKDQLSVACESVNVVYLAHGLESMQNPHEILREAYRVLTPEGIIIISGFNPWSIWGLINKIFIFGKKYPWRKKFLSMNKIVDWLSLLGFEIGCKYKFLYIPPINHEKFLSKMSGYETINQKISMINNGAYMITARKKILGLTLVGLDFKVRGNLGVAHGLARPTLNEHK